MRNGLCSILILDIVEGALSAPPSRTEVPSQKPALVRVKRPQQVFFSYCFTVYDVITIKLFNFEIPQN